MKTQTKGNLLL